MAVDRAHALGNVPDTSGSSDDLSGSRARLGLPVLGRSARTSG